jgi:anthranilate phosphoribosyltransferase
MLSDTFKPLLAKLAAGEVLSEEDAQAFFAACLKGEPSSAQIASAVTAMRVRGETIGEIAAGARALRAAAMKLEHPYDVVDTCGTGGDGRRTLNISTAAALVAAGGGIRVAKHGTKAQTSQSGSSDVLKALGVNIDASPAQSRRALDEANICFLFAPAHHGALAHVSPVRQELGFRTIFNLLGPLANPAGAKRQVLGVADPKWLEPLAEVLGELGAEHAWVVHGQGMDEMSIAGITHVAEWKDGQVRTFKVTPEDAGVPRGSLGELLGGAPDANARALRAALEGRRSAYSDVVVLTAAAVFLVAGKAGDLKEGAAMADASLRSGRALAALEKLVEITNAPVAA